MTRAPPLPASLPLAPIRPGRSCKEAHTKLEAAFIGEERDWTGREGLDGVLTDLA